MAKKPENLDPNDPANEAYYNSYYFDNYKVEQLLTKYVNGGCVDVDLRDEIMSHASELINQIIRTHNFHNVYPGKDPASFGDLFQTAWSQIESVLYKFDSAPGHTKVFNMWCLNPSELVISDRGIISIGDAVTNFEQSGCSVYGLDGMSKMVGALRRPSTETIKLAIKYNYEIECTPEHKFLTLDEHEGDLKWKQAKNLRLGDLLAVQCGQEIFVGNNDLSDIVLKSKGHISHNKTRTNGIWNVPAVWTEELAYVVGLFVAEGSYSYDKLVIHNTDEDIVRNLIDNTLGLNFVYEPKYQRVSLCNKRFIEFLKYIGFSAGLACDQKFIPKRILLSSKPIQSAFIKGMFDGDGGSTIGRGVSYHSTSLTLIKQLRMLLLNMGFVSSINTNGTGSFDGSKKECWGLSLPTVYSSKFYNEIGFGSRRKQAKANSLPKPRSMIYGLNKIFKKLYDKYPIVLRGNKKYRLRSILEGKYCTVESAKKQLLEWSDHVDDNYYKFINDRINDYLGDGQRTVWLPITSLEQSENEVCEISVDSDSHSYLANGIVTHNSQVAKTVILAHIKKEMRDKKNADSYKRHLGNKKPRKSVKIDRFLSEARETFKYNDEYKELLCALGKLYEIDIRPHEGLIGKLVDLSGFSRQKVTDFLKDLRLKSMMFTDSPIHEEKDHKDKRVNNQKANFEEDDYD